VWDAIEPLRPTIDAKVFEFIAKHEFARSDFPQSGSQLFRLSREVTTALLDEVVLPQKAIDRTVKWLTELIGRVKLISGTS
jgi:CRISPR/Cas system-associated endonuclease Cas1